MTDYALRTLASCRRCPRLVKWHTQVRREYPSYHASPVGAWGDWRARLLIVGLAPGLHGAARTGRAFVGDASGEFLFAALYRQGFASTATPPSARLIGARVTNVVKCLPPQNAPKAAEIRACGGYLREELRQLCPSAMRLPRVIVALGGVAHRAVCGALDLRRDGFAHGMKREIANRTHLISSIHPSRLNVNTKRLSAAMLDEIFVSARALLG